MYSQSNHIPWLIYIFITDLSLISLSVDYISAYVHVFFCKYSLTSHSLLHTQAYIKGFEL